MVVRPYSIYEEEEIFDMRRLKPHIRFLWFLAFLIACIGLFSFNKYNAEHPKVEWDTSSENVVISYMYFGEIDIGYIPDFRIWGDGYIVWVEKDEGSRRVYEGYLSQSELRELLERFVNAGFYDWFGNDNSLSVYVGINLSSGYKQISINSSEEISRLVEYVSKGAGVDAKEFVPAIGYMYAVPIEKTSYYNYTTTPYKWSQKRLEVDFENFDGKYPDGVEISGDELIYTWEIVNNVPFIESDGKIYWIALLIPKITN